MGFPFFCLIRIIHLFRAGAATSSFRDEPICGLYVVADMVSICIFQLLHINWLGPLTLTASIASISFRKCRIVKDRYELTNYCSPMCLIRKQLPFAACLLIAQAWIMLNVAETSNKIMKIIAEMKRMAGQIEFTEELKQQALRLKWLLCRKSLLVWVNTFARQRMRMSTTLA